MKNVLFISGFFRRKGYFAALFILQLTTCQFQLFGQVPQAIPYQAVARDSQGNLIANHPIDLRFSIIDSVITGAVVYQETQHVTTNELGLFTLNILQGNATGTFNPILWQTNAKFIKVEMDANGSGVFVDMGTQQMMSVPYALYAEKSGSSLGSVVYVGTWDAVTNNPPLSSGVGTKGYYYVVTNASASSNATLDGINDWRVNDWAIYNGSKWQKVDNSQVPVNASDVSFTPNGDITATNVQDAVVEARDKVDTHLSDYSNPHAVTKSQVGLGNVPDVDATNPPNISQDATHRFVTDTQISTWNGKQNALGYTPVPDARTVNGHALSTDITITKSDVGLGNVDNTSDVSKPLSTATKQYVDDGDALMQTNINTKVSKSGDTMSGDLVLNADPASPLGAATKQYVDAGDATVQNQVNSKVSKSGDTMSGDLVLNADPASPLGAATKQYVDASCNLKADKVVGGTVNDIASLDANGNLVDGGKKLSDYLAKDNSTPYSPTADYNPATKKYVDDHATSVVPNGTAIGQTLHWNGGAWVADSGIYSNGKRFGIGIGTPEAPLGIKGEDGGDDGMISFKSADISQSWNIKLNPTSVSTPGFSIEDVSSGSSLSRLFISSGDGKIGIGTNDPTEMLQLQSTLIEDRYLLGLRVYNGAAVNNQGWSFGHVHDATQASRDGAFSFFENGTIPTQQDERVTILPGGNVGINEKLPYATLHVTRPAADPLTDISMTIGTGIMMAGQSDGQNLVFDNHQIQARVYDPLKSYTVGDASLLGLQPMGGGILIHGGSSISDERKMMIDSSGKVGIGTITPLEKLHIEGSADGDYLSLQIQNLSSGHSGWMIAHADDSTTPERVGAFGILEKDGSTKVERITILPKLVVGLNPIYNVGINEKLPYATLHVSRTASDPLSDISLAENTGILLLGPIDAPNLGFDSHSIQARTGSNASGGGTVICTTTHLDVQPLGGDINVHSNYSSDRQMVITDGGLVGLGKTPVERLDVNGAVTIGDSYSSTPADGTIRWHAPTGDLEVYKSGVWVSLTMGADGFVSSGTNSITYNPTDAKVGIGVSNPTSALYVSGHSSVTSDNSSAIIENKSSTSSTNADTRIGLEIKCSGSWSSIASAKNIGLHISNVSGQSSSNSNIAAVMNGNVVVGDLISSQMVGTNGTNVLAIQNGTAPSSAISSDLGTTDGGVQLFSKTDPTGVSTFNVMNGNGDVIQLSRASALTPADTSSIGSTYGATEAALIKNMRDRINDLETRFTKSWFIALIILTRI